MNDPEAPGGGRLLEIAPEDIGFIARAADTVAAEVDATPKTINDATRPVAEHLAGWDSAATLNGASMQWTSKTAALTHGADGVAEFAAALRQFVADVTATDAAAATGLETNAGVEAEFGGDYEPAAATDYAYQLTTGSPPPK